MAALLSFLATPDRGAVLLVKNQCRRQKLNSWFQYHKAALQLGLDPASCIN
jgi:hypothetical protein